MNALIKSHALLGLMTWRRALLASLPAWTSARENPQPSIEIDGHPPYRVTRVEREHRGIVEPQELRPRSVKTAFLVLSSDNVLRRTTTFPVAALGDLDAILKLDLTVSTPFEPDEVLFTHRLLGPPRQGRLTVEVAMVQKNQVQASLDAIRERYGSSPGRLMLGPEHSIEFDETIASKKAAAFRLDALLVLLAATLAILVIWAAFNRQGEAIQGARLEISRSLAGIENIAQLRKQIDARRQLEGFLGDKRAQAPSMRALLRALSSSLPQDVSLAALTADGGNFTASFSGRGLSVEGSQVDGVASAILQPGYRLSPSADSQTIAVAGRLAIQAGNNP